MSKQKQTGRIDLRGLEQSVLDKLRSEARKKNQSLNEYVGDILRAYHEADEYRLGGHLYEVHLSAMARDQKLLLEKLKKREASNQEILKRLDRYEFLVSHWLDMEYKDDDLFYQDLIKEGVYEK